MVEAINMARMIPLGSPVGQIALSVCTIRGVNPFDFYRGGHGLANWQAIIAEQLLTMQLQDVLRTQGL